MSKRESQLNIFTAGEFFTPKQVADGVKQLDIRRQMRKDVTGETVSPNIVGKVVEYFDPKTGKTTKVAFLGRENENGLPSMEDTCIWKVIED